MPIVYRNDKGEKLTFDELDGNFSYLVSQIPTDALSSVLEDGKIYIGNNLNEAEKQTLNTALVPETINKNYQTDNQKLYNDATSSIQTQLNAKANDSDVLHKTGNETATGIKTFSDQIKTPLISANTSAGLVLESNGGTDVALLGAGGGSGATFYGGVIFDTLTASTMAFLNGSKQLVSAVATTFGTWLQTFTAKTTPIDADTLTLGDSVASFEAKKVTMLQTWDNYYKVKADGLYNGIFTISNNVWVDLNNGNDGTGLIKRQDKPFLTLQAGINAIIALGGSDFWQVNILGDFTYTTSALTFTRSNLVIISSGKITNAIPNVNTATSLINFTGDNVEIRLNNYTQTTNQSTLSCSGINNTLFINTAYLKPSKTGQFGIYFNNGVGSSFIGQNIYLDVTNPGITFYAYVIQCRYMHIANLFISGVSSNAINFTEIFDSFIINNIYYTCTYSGTSVFQIVSNASVVRFARVDYMSLNSFTGTHLNTPFFGGEYQMFDLNTVESTHRRLLMSVSASSKVIEFGNILHAGRILENGVGQAFTNIYLGKITLTYITKNEDNAFSLGCGSKLFDGELIVTDTASQPTWGLITWYSISTTKSTCQMNNVTIQYLGDTSSTNYIMTYYASGTNFNLQLANCTFIHKEGNTNGGWIKNHLGNGVNANIKILGTLSLKYNNYTTGTGALLIPSGEMIVDSSLIINN